jgi:hypothetical protein
MENYNTYDSFGIDTQREHVVFMRKDCHQALTLEYGNCGAI